MKRALTLEYEGKVVKCGLSTKYKHYKVQVDGSPAGWVDPGAYRAYNAQAECIGTFKSLDQAAYAVAEHYVHFR